MGFAAESDVWSGHSELESLLVGALLVFFHGCRICYMAGGIRRSYLGTSMDGLSILEDY